MALEPFAERFPDRFFNVGVAEQNMVGMATGARRGGLHAVRLLDRHVRLDAAYEFIRNGPVLHGLPVRVVGIGGGMDYGTNGMTHYALEDGGVMRVQPGMTVVAPADAEQARAALRRPARARAGILPAGEGRRRPVAGLDGRFGLGRAQVRRRGSDILFFAIGPGTLEAVAAAEILERDGIEATVVVVSASARHRSRISSMSCRGSTRGHRRGALRERCGGLARGRDDRRARLHCRLIRCGVTSMPDGRSGSQAYLHRLHGISGDELRRRVADALDTDHQSVVARSV